jgi:ubiquitin-protein ligase
MSLSLITQKRLFQETKRFRENPFELIDIYTCESNCLIWYFILKGMSYSDYTGGFFIGKIILPNDYPDKAPDFYMLTPNGRFQIDSKICITISGYHQENWNPSWNIGSMLVGMISIMADDTTAGISHIKRSKKERKGFVDQSFNFNKKNYYDILKKFAKFVILDDGNIIRMKTDEETTEWIKNNVNQKKFTSIKVEKKIENKIEEKKVEISGSLLKNILGEFDEKKIIKVSEKEEKKIVKVPENEEKKKRGRPKKEIK